MTSNQTILIDDKSYHADTNYLHLIKNTSGFEKDIFSFLQDWYSISDVICVSSSGSTEQKKSIFLSKKAMVASAGSTCLYFGIDASDTLHLCLPIKYIAGKMMLVRALVSGARLIIEEPSSSPLKENQERITFSAMTPMQISGLLDAGPDRILNVAQLIIGGAQVLPVLQERLQSINTACYGTFGMTETATHVALKRLNGELSDDIFQALGDVFFKVDDRNCLVIESEKRDIDDLITNDIVTLLDNRSFRWLGRFDNVINTGGVKVFPESVELKLSNQFTENYFIASLSDSQYGEIVILLVEGGQRKIDFDCLDKYEQPKRVFFVKEFSYTESGKIQRTKTLNKIIDA